MSVCVCTHVRGINLGGIAPTLALVLAYMCACAHVNIYIYVKIYKALYAPMYVELIWGGVLLLWRWFSRTCVHAHM